MKIYKRYLILVVQMVAILFATNAFSQEVKNNYVEAQRGISKERKAIQTFSGEDFPAIKTKIAINRRVTENDLNDNNVPDEIEKKEILKYARAYREYGLEVVNIQKKYANSDNYGFVKDFLIKEYELHIEKINSVTKLYEDAIKNKLTFAQINKADQDNDKFFDQKNSALNLARDNFFASFANVENDYLEFNNCISQINQKNQRDAQLGTYPDTIYIKFKNDEICKKFKLKEPSEKAINQFLGQGGKPASISVKDAESYKFDVELYCSSLNFFGGILSLTITKGGQVQIPPCTRALATFTDNYSRIGDFYKNKKAEEKAKIDQNELQKLQATINARRAIAKNDVVAQVLNYSNGIPENASGPNFYYPINIENGSCVYGMQSDTSILGQFSESLMGAFASMAPILGAAGIQQPNMSTTFDLSKADFSSIAFYKLNGTTPRTRNSEGTPYLKYQTKISGLPDFECDFNNCSIDRLQKAWNLVAQNCKGAKKPF